MRPQVRGGTGPYRSRIRDLLGNGRSAAVERLVVEMYARGLSTRDIEHLFRGPDGEVLLSKNTLTELTDALWGSSTRYSAIVTVGTPCGLPDPGRRVRARVAAFSTRTVNTPVGLFTLAWRYCAPEDADPLYA
jgi:hypothetical protein